MRCIVASKQDIAGMNILKWLIKNYEFTEAGGVYKNEDESVMLISIDSSLLYADLELDVEYYVFASRHKSIANRKTLTTHVTGNLTSQALYGGKPKSLAYANADAMKIALVELKKARDELGIDYEVCLEATHHGPTELSRPLLFVEVGSTEKEWRDSKAIEVAARACYKAATNKKEFQKAIGIGGTHYAPLHTRVVLETDIAIGHIIPSYAIDELEFEVFKEAVEKTQASFGFLDWKGMKSRQRKKIKKFAEDIKLELKRGRDLLR